MAAYRFRSDSYALGGSPPTSTAVATLVTTLRAADATTYGVDCTMARGVSCAVSVDSTKTIVSGSLRAYCYMPVAVTADGAVSARRWVKCPALDITLTGGSTERDEPSGDLEVPEGAYRFAYVPDAVIGSTGATTFLITYGVRRDAI